MLLRSRYYVTIWITRDFSLFDPSHLIPRLDIILYYIPYLLLYLSYYIYFILSCHISYAILL